mmetsp:Transcript_26467/g.47506  ORF Transcript_26467/g.47506 Transcript_26467/m.47506 type:complete len:312 (-) Transcript_26467:185-1120(-)
MLELSPQLTAEVLALDLFSAAKLYKPSGRVAACDGNCLKTYTSDPFVKATELKLPSSLYDFCWHGESLLVLMRDFPMTLKSVETGLTLAQYPVVNLVQEIRSPMSAAFTGDKTIVTGLGNRLILGDMPSFTMDYRLLETETLSSRSMLSAFDCREFLVAIGSYNCETYLYDIRDNAITAKLTGQQGGIIQLALHDSYLLTAGRKDNFILQWDLRNLNLPLNTSSFYREHKTHQRVLFSIDGCWLGAGNDNGSIYIYNLQTSQLAYYFSADFDAVNSVQLSGRRLVSSSGQRHLDEKRSSLIREWNLLELEH